MGKKRVLLEEKKLRKTQYDIWYRFYNSRARTKEEKLARKKYNDSRKILCQECNTNLKQPKSKMCQECRNIPENSLNWKGGPIGKKERLGIPCPICKKNIIYPKSRMCNSCWIEYISIPGNGPNWKGGSSAVRERNRTTCPVCKENKMDSRSEMCKSCLVEYRRFYPEWYPGYIGTDKVKENIKLSSKKYYEEVGKIICPSCGVNKTVRRRNKHGVCRDCWTELCRDNPALNGGFIDGRTKKQDYVKNLLESKKIICPSCGINKIHTKSDMCLKCRGMSQRGDGHPNWNGGHYNYLMGFYSIRQTILERDNDTCQCCSITGEELGRCPDIHHIDSNKNNNEDYNLITLCRKCHQTKEFKEYREALLEWQRNLLNNIQICSDSAA